MIRFPGWIVIPICLLLIGASLLAVLLTHEPFHKEKGSTSPTSTQNSTEWHDPYTCEALGLNDCWRPSVTQEGPPYMGFAETRPPRTKSCTVKALNDPSQDDAPEIRKAFQDCSQDANIIFENTTYHIATVLNTTGLRNVDIELNGTLKWNNDDIHYWLSNSLPIGFQNQSSAWHLGGESLHFYGHGYGMLNGDGQVWYEWNRATGNRHGRPHALTITDSKDSVFEGLNFYRAQMWTMTVIRSEQILLQDINIDNRCAPGKGTFGGCNVNTDGIDTIYANNVTLLRWQVQNGDDCISAKQNSTNIHIADSKLSGYSCFAMGSIGQYPGQTEVIANITARNVTCAHSYYGVFVKTWTGITKGEPPNGGGGGIGSARNMSFADLTFDAVGFAYHFEQNTSYNGQRGGEETSKFHISDVTLGPARGTLTSQTVADLSCSGAAPCSNISVVDTVLSSTKGSAIDEYLCKNVQDPQGFHCK